MRQADIPPSSYLWRCGGRECGTSAAELGTAENKGEGGQQDGTERGA